jgi:hypothetical protein
VREIEARYTFCSKECSNEAKRLQQAQIKEGLEPDDLAQDSKNEDNARLRQQLRQSQAKCFDTLRELNKLKTFSGLIEDVLTAAPPAAPAWVCQSKKTLSRNAIPTALLSDAHFGEVVLPEQIEYVNAYNREIAELRLKTFFNNVCELAHGYLKGLDYEGVVLAIAGDMFSGDIHEELARTNAGTIQEELLYWIDPMVAGIKLLKKEFKKVFIPSVVGNHPRATLKPIHKMRVPNNFDWLFMEVIKRSIGKDDSIVFDISKSSDVNFKLYETRYKMTHGDSFKGGAGIAGLLSPLMIGDARKRKRAQVIKAPYDWLVMGHWHQYAVFKNIIVNSSLKGYDEYAYDKNFEFEPPRQAFWITDPVHGVTITAPIHVESKEETWRDNTSVTADSVFGGRSDDSQNSPKARE